MRLRHAKTAVRCSYLLGILGISLLAAPLAQAQSAMPPQRLLIGLDPTLFRAAGSDHGRIADARIAALSRQLGVSLTRLRTTATGAEVVELSQPLSAEALTALRRQIGDAEPGLRFVDEDRLLQTTATPNDTQYSQQWDLYEAVAGINAPTAWNTATGTGVVVGVIDTGYRPHADLVANVLTSNGYDFISATSISNDGNGRDADASDPGDWTTAGQCYSGSPATNSSWHGTHVAGTIAAVTNNAAGVAGIAYGAKILPLRALGRCGGYTSDIADALVWGAGGSVSGLPTNTKPAKVLSLSLGGQGACDTTTQTAINTARNRGATVVVAAGNSNADASGFTPANCSGVITVASVGRSGAKAYYSNYGSIVTLAAPGGDMSTGTANGILSTFNSGTTTPGADAYGYYQGTSQATPHVSATVALMLQANPSLTPDQIKTGLTKSARAFPASCNQCGAGLLDAAAAINYAKNPGATITALTNNVTLSGLAAATGQDVYYSIAVPAGATNLSIKISGGTGEADLYVKFGATPTTTTYDCRPYLTGNTETCSFATTQTGTYYIDVRGRSAYSGLSLVASYTMPAASCPSGYTAYNGTISAVGGVSYAPSSSGFTPKASGTLAGQLSAGSGIDFDLYLDMNYYGTWVTVAYSALDKTSAESLSYPATGGFPYRWRVVSWAGTGAYLLCSKSP